MPPFFIREAKFVISLCLYVCPLVEAFCIELVDKQRVDTTLIVKLNESSGTITRSHPDSSRFLAYNALALSRGLHFGKGKALSYNNLGSASFFQEKYDSAYYYWNLSLKEWERIGNNARILKMLGNVALSLKLQNNYAEAISYNQRAVRLGLHIKDTLQVAIAYGNIGIMYAEVGDTKKAIDFNYKALNLYEIIRDSVGLSSSYSNLGTVYKLATNLDSADLFLKKALALKIIQNDLRGSADTYVILTELYFLKNSFEIASNNIRKGFELAKELNSQDLIVELNLWQAKVYLKQRKVDLALQSVNACNEYLNEQNLVSNVTALNLLARIYHRKKQFDKAVFYYDLYSAKNDSLQKVDGEKQIAELTAKYNYDLRESKLENDQTLNQIRLERQIEKKQLDQSRLIIILLFTSVVLLVIFWYFVLLKRKNNALQKQQQEIEQRTLGQQEVIEMRTAELLSTKDVISHYAFLNSHELRAPLAKILGIVYLSDQMNVQENTFIKSLKTSAKELEEAVKKINKELTKS